MGRADMASGNGARQPLPGRRVFSCFAAVDPARVWDALTDARHTAGYLYGMVAESTWEVDAPIVFRLGGEPCLIGRVLCAQPERRLSYLAQAGPDDPSVYLTWLLRPSLGGTTIGLHVDEVEDPSGDDEDAENVWLPVLAGLQRALELR